MKVRINESQVKALFDDIEDMPYDVMREAGAYFKSKTPIDKGNARRNTRTNGLVIKADYAYADRLDNGWSKQAPGGMSDPTIDFIQREVDKRVGRL